MNARTITLVPAGSVLALIALLAAPLPAAVWEGDAGNDNWSDAANWDTGDVPDTNAETARFNDTDDTGTAQLDDGSKTIGGIQADGAGHSQTIDLNGNDLVVEGNVYIADGNQGAPAASTSDLTVTGGGNFQLGQSGSPVDLFVGISTAAGVNDGTLRVDSGTFTGFFNTLAIARGGGDSNEAVGAVDLTGATIGNNGVIEINVLDIAAGNKGDTRGELTFGASSNLSLLKINTRLRMGFHKESHGTLNLPTTTGVTFQVGDPVGGSRADFIYADTESISQEGATADGTLATGDFQGTFTVNLDQWWIASGPSRGAYQHGTIDLTNATIGNGGVIDVNDLFLGANTQGTDSTSSQQKGSMRGVLKFNNTLTRLTVNEQFYVGFAGQNSGGPAGELDLPTAGSFVLEIGEFGATRADFVVGGHTWNHNQNTSVAGNITTGAVTGVFDVYLDELSVSRNRKGTGSTPANSSATLDLSGMSVANGGVIDVNKLYVGTGPGFGVLTARGQNSTGTLALPGGTDTFQVNEHFEVAGPGVDTTGTLTLPAAATVRLGVDDASRAMFLYGVHTTNDSNDNGTSQANGTLSDGSFTGSFGGFVTDMLVGVNSATAGAAGGAIDLSGATLLGLDISGDLKVGPGINAVGSLLLPDGEVTAATATVGSADSGSDGFVQLDGTELTLTDGTGALSIDSTNGEIHSIFSDAAPGGTWSIAWEGGDFTGDLDGYFTGGQLTVAYGGPLQIGSWYDGGLNTSYFGVLVPEPGTIGLLAVGGVAVLRRRRPR